jgi:hypothetical protein
MHPLPLPGVNPAQMYEDSYSRVRASELKSRYRSETSKTVNSGADFSRAAAADESDLLASADFEPSFATAAEMVDLYDKRVQPPGSAGRQHYDELMAAVPHQRCPYCGERRVKSIDHYLPKSSYSTLAVTPNNLVPCCNDCNHAKGSYTPSSAQPPVMHPYFDKVDRSRWLYASVQSTTPPAIRFEVRRSAPLTDRESLRIEKHFELFKLANLYASHAGQVIDELDNRLPPVFHNGGASSLRQYLLDEANLRSFGRINTWQRALFEALAGSEWYCNDYFS